VAAAPFDRTFRFVQNHLFFRNVSIEDIYAVRLLTEPDLAAGAVPHLTPGDLDLLARSIELCSHAPRSEQAALEQRQEDLHFHDILARANPNPFLRFVLEAARGKNQRKVRELMTQHITQAAEFSRKLKAQVVPKLVLQGDMESAIALPADARRQTGTRPLPPTAPRRQRA
jgi:DNA-binding FadR family transcriptional regulator